MVSKCLSGISVAENGQKRNSRRNGGYLSFGILHAKGISSWNLISQWDLNNGRKFMFKFGMFHVILIWFIVFFFFCTRVDDIARYNLRWKIEYKTKFLHNTQLPEIFLRRSWPQAKECSAMTHFRSCTAYLVPGEQKGAGVDFRWTASRRQD